MAGPASTFTYWLSVKNRIGVRAALSGKKVDIRCRPGLGLLGCNGDLLICVDVDHQNISVPVRTEGSIDRSKIIETGVSRRDDRCLSFQLCKQIHPIKHWGRRIAAVGFLYKLVIVSRTCKPVSPQHWYYNIKRIDAQVSSGKRR